MSDKEMLELIRNEDSRQSGFDLLVRQYQKQVYWHIRRMVVDHEDTNDLVQEVFIKVWKGVDEFREDASLYTWIYRITVNETMNYLKKKRLRLMLPLAGKEKNLAESLKDDQYFSGDAIQQKLHHAILKLPPRQRLVFNMKYFEDMTYETISDILKTSTGSLKASYHIAVKKIEGYLLND